MRKLSREAPPAQLAAAAAKELAAAETYFVTDGKTKGFKFKVYQLKDVKARLADMTSGKCAYCEADYDATQPADVEHYRPKGALVTEAGKVEPAYWWLAAQWDNLLPSCIRCNRVETQSLYDGSQVKLGKGERFPLLDESNRAKKPGGEAQEIPLLIDPFREDPAIYIEFVDDGGYCIAKPVDRDENSIAAKRARASIDIYGLNRVGLVRDRSRYMRRARAAALRLRKLFNKQRALVGSPQGIIDRIAEEIRDELELLDEMMDGSDRYTGMIRTLAAPEFA